MIRIAQWLWTCEPSVAAHQIEHTAFTHRPPLAYIDLTPSDPMRKRLVILEAGRQLLEVWCSPVDDTCVEVYVGDPMPRDDRDLIMGFVSAIEARAKSLKLVRRRVGFRLDSQQA